MADAVKTQRITRDQIAAVFGGNTRAIRLFEALLADVSGTLPDATAEAAASAALANQAAEDAAIAAAQAQLTADTILAESSELSDAPGLDLIYAELQQLRERVSALEQGLNP